MEVWDSWPSQQQREPPPMPYFAIAAAAVLGTGIVIAFGMVIQGTLEPPHQLPNVATSTANTRPHPGQSTQWPWVKATTNAAMTCPESQR